jgi:hypothetical protein
MATSGSTDWTSTRNDIIQSALELCGVLEPGATAGGEQITHGSKVLNIMVKSWQGMGVPMLWKYEWDTQTFSTSSIVSNGGTNYVCLRGHTSAASDEPGVGANWTTYWKETSDTAAGAWVISTAYTSNADFALDSDTLYITDAFIRENQNDIPIEIISRTRYTQLVDKDYESNWPVALYFDRQLSPRCYVYPRPPDNPNVVLHFQKVKIVEDFDNASDNPDFPVRWIQALEYGLAANLGDRYHIPIGERNTYRQLAAEILNKLKGAEVEIETSTFMTSAYSSRRY